MRMVAVLLMSILFNCISGETMKPKEYFLDGNERLSPRYGRLKKPRDPFRRRGFYDAADDYDELDNIRMALNPRPGNKGNVADNRKASQRTLEDDKIPKATWKTLT
ncbi:unnamed protein product [Cylicocyclus nassatus]|uniref:Uncharacterized protein n=1 Tax=Cylicocyclus nassatus TaxID=53992 RepID=A0AA36GT54_CYLNA|nr:unnamed protein product [Cylicocyclus nassatus]